MARGYLKDVEYRQTDISMYIIKLMRSSNKRQKDLANLLGITESRMSQKLKEGLFTTHELLTIFKHLKADQESVGKLFTF